MEYGKAGANDKVFIFGIICLVISLGLLLISLYILPYFLFDLHYSMPDFMLDMLAKFQDDYGYTISQSKIFIWMIFFIPGLIFGLISFFVSKHLDKLEHGSPTAVDVPEKSGKELTKELKESASLGFKIIGLIVIIFIGVVIVQYFFQSTSTQPLN